MHVREDFPATELGGRRRILTGGVDALTVTSEPAPAELELLGQEPAA
jgi:hypothetical protein